jgi:uncharacterized membrane protein YvlD (DUF360 family)
VLNVQVRGLLHLVVGPLHFCVGGLLHFNVGLLCLMFRLEVYYT